MVSSLRVLPFFNMSQQSSLYLHIAHELATALDSADNHRYSSPTHITLERTYTMVHGMDGMDGMDGMARYQESTYRGYAWDRHCWHPCGGFGSGQSWTNAKASTSSFFLRKSVMVSDSLTDHERDITGAPG